MSNLICGSHFNSADALVASQPASLPPSPPTPTQTASFFCYQEKFAFYTYSHTHSHTPACRCTSLAVPSFTFSVHLQLGSDGSRFLHTVPPAAGRPPLSLPPDLASSLAHAIVAVTLQDLTRSVARSSLKQETMQELVPQEEEETSEATASPPGRC